MRCRQGSARPREESSCTPDDTPNAFAVPDRVAISQLDGCAPRAAELDPRLFHGLFMLINRDNECCGVVETAAAAWAALDERADVASIVGTLHEDFEAVDIDPADRPGTDPIVGQAIAEQLVTWATRNGFPWLVRESGRPGGFHVIIRVPETHTAELRQRVRDLARPFGDRTRIASLRRPRTLRLLGAPHRHGHPSPIISGTLRPADIAPPAAAEDPTRQKTTGRRRGGKRAGIDRSLKELGDVCGALREGLTAAQAWRAITSRPGTKCAEQGEIWFRTYLWFVAVTLIAAEQGADEDTGWHRAQQACAARATELGREQWRRDYWAPALLQAAEVHLLRVAYRQVADALITAHSTNPKRARSIRAVLDALALVNVTRSGSIAQRQLAECAAVSRSSVVVVLAELVEWGIIERAHRYADGAEDSDAYQPGRLTREALETIRTTRSVTPHGTPRTRHCPRPHHETPPP